MFPRFTTALSIASLLFGAAFGSRLAACPFCNAVLPTFAERRAEASAVVLAAAEGTPKFRVVQVISGRDSLGDRNQIEVAPSDDAARDAGDVAEGRLALLLGKPSDGAWSW